MKQEKRLPLVVEGREFKWEQEFITGAEIKSLAAINADSEIYLSVQEPWEDELITNETRVNLARPEIEQFYCKKELRYTVNGKAFGSNKQYVKGEYLRKQGGIPADEDLFLKVEKPWEDELICDHEWVDLARPGTEHFISKAIAVILIVDGREKKWNERTISFAQVVKLAKGNFTENDQTYYTVTYDRGPKQNPAGTMVKGDVVFVKNKMIFNVTATDKS